MIQKNMLRWLSDVISVFCCIADTIDHTAFLFFGNIVFCIHSTIVRSHSQKINTTNLTI